MTEHETTEDRGSRRRPCVIHKSFPNNFPTYLGPQETLSMARTVFYSGVYKQLNYLFSEVDVT